MYFQKIFPLRGQFIPGGDLVENRCFTEVKLVNVCRFFIMKRQLFEKIFPLRGQFIHCNLIYTKNSGGRLSGSFIEVKENGSFIEVKVANVSGFSDSDSEICSTM